MRWDEKKLAVMVNRESELVRLRDDTAVRMTEMTKEGTDKTMSDADDRVWHRLNAEHIRLTNELRQVQDARGQMEGLRPQPVGSRAELPVLQRFLSRGPRGLSQEERDAHIIEDHDHANLSPNAIGFRLRMEPNLLVPRQRGLGPRQQTRSDATGAGNVGSAVDDEFYPDLVETLAYFGDVSEPCTSFSTDTGGDFKFNTVAAATEEGARMDDQSESTSDDDFVGTGVVTFNAYTYHSKRMNVRRESLTDVHFNLARRLDMEVVRRIARKQNRDYTVGTGAAGQPQGIVTAAKGGVTAAAAAAVAVTEIEAMEYAVDRAYRKQTEGNVGGFMGMAGGSVGWMMSDGLERLLRGLKDGDNRPLWTAGIMDPGAYGITGPRPTMLLGYPVFVNGAMDAPATGKVPLVFGSLGYFGVRTVAEIEIFSFFDSGTAVKNSVQVIGFARGDARAIGAIRPATSNPSADRGKCDAIAKLTMG